LLERAYGKGIHPNTSFWIASMTKGFTAAAVLRLQKEGRLKVSDSISRFLPDVPPDKRNITIHQLLTHTSGLGGEYSGGGITERSKAVNAILQPDLIAPPGTRYKYGDDDYELLAAIIEIVSHRSWEDYVHKKFISPLHLSHTAFACPASCDWGHKGANGMRSTARDVLKWSRALMANEYGAITHPQIFVRKDGAMDVSYSYGARIYTLDGKVVEVMHSGSGDNDNTSIVRNLSSGVTIIVLANSGQHQGTTWASYIAHHIGL